ncbi:MAG: ABC transporter ATP-binding protein [Leptolinea sp.]|jgi:putative ABC transport system ATP-binding protein|nr:ABC transporter ATP-binding protein [Leptolinea sp.]
MRHIQFPSSLIPSRKDRSGTPISTINQIDTSAYSEERKPLIEMQNIYKTYNTHAGDFTALNDVSASFYPGQFVSIIGKSGSGKSTLLNMITGIDRPTSGKIKIENTYLQELTESEFSEWRGRNLGIVFQFFQLLPMLSLVENTILPMDFCHMYPPAEREKRARELLKLVGLQDFAEKLPAAVSGGQEQCAAIARALANDPPIIVADEPTGNLDSKTADMVLQLIDELVRQGKTVLVVTHDETVARRASRTLVICDGELVDEDISRMLPSISHRSMLKLSHQSVELCKQPNEDIFASSNSLPGLMLILEGKVALRGANNHRLASYPSGSILSGKFIRNTLAQKKTFRADPHAAARIKMISVEDLESTVNTSRSMQIFMQKLEAGGPSEVIDIPEASKNR